MSETRLVSHSRSFPPIGQAPRPIFYTRATELATLTRTGHWDDHRNPLGARKVHQWFAEGLLLRMACLLVLVRL